MLCVGLFSVMMFVQAMKGPSPLRPRTKAKLGTGHAFGKKCIGRVEHNGYARYSSNKSSPFPKKAGETRWYHGL